MSPWSRLGTNDEKSNPSEKGLVMSFAIQIGAQDQQA